MEKILGSRKDINNIEDEYTNEFLHLIEDILAIDAFNKLEYFTQHINTTRKQHSMHVAYYTYRWSKALHLDYASATRGALLHDFYLYDWQNHEAPIEGRHVEVHPMVALSNAQKYVEVNPIMMDCILHHMWPIAKNKPQTKEGLIVQAADKYAASLELGNNSYHMIKPRLVQLLSLLK